MTTSPADHDAQHRHHQEGPAVHTLLPNASALTGLAPTPQRGPDLPCQENPADLWFAELPHEVEQAKELCQPCPLREQCLAGALERAEPWGVWGGQLLLRGTVVPRKRPRGRPRKDAAAA